jgi:hypothetical protein
MGVKTELIGQNLPRNDERVKSEMCWIIRLNWRKEWLVRRKLEENYLTDLNVKWGWKINC